MKRIFFIFFIFFISTKKDCAQEITSPQDITRKINRYLMDNGPNTTKLKDSVDFYTFAIEFKVSQKNKKTIVESIKVNDSIAYILYKDFDFLRQINFYSIVKSRKNSTIVIPVGIIIAYVNYPVTPIPMLKAEELMPKIVKMFNQDYKKNNQLSKFIYLDPVLCLCSTKIYH